MTRRGVDLFVVSVFVVNVGLFLLVGAYPRLLFGITCLMYAGYLTYRLVADLKHSRRAGFSQQPSFPLGRLSTGGTEPAEGRSVYPRGCEGDVGPHRQGREAP